MPASLLKVPNDRLGKTSFLVKLETGGVEESGGISVFVVAKLEALSKTELKLLHVVCVGGFRSNKRVKSSQFCKHQTAKVDTSTKTR